MPRFCGLAELSRLLDLGMTAVTFASTMGQLDAGVRSEAFCRAGVIL
jgi:hypothetical protein